MAHVALARPWLLRACLALAACLAAVAAAPGGQALPTACMDGTGPQNCGTGWEVSVDPSADINVNTPAGERAAGEVLRLGVQADATNIYFFVKVASNPPPGDADAYPAAPVGAPPPPGATTPVPNSVAYSIRMEVAPNACVGVAPRYISPEGWINNNVYNTACTAVVSGGGGPNALVTTPEWVCNEAKITLGWAEIGLPAPDNGAVFNNIRVIAQDSNVATFTFDAGPTGGVFTVGENGYIWQGPPTITSVRAYSDNTVRVRWDAGDDNGAQPVTKWNIYRQAGSAPMTLYDTIPAGGLTEYIDDGVVNNAYVGMQTGVQYTYRVSGVSCDALPQQPLANYPGETQISLPAGVTPDFRPLPVDGVSVFAPTMDSLNIEWTPQAVDCPAAGAYCPSAATDATASGVAGFELWGGTPFSEALLDTVDPTECGATCALMHDNLESQVTYCYFVVVVDAHDEIPTAPPTPTGPNRSPATTRTCRTTLGAGGFVPPPEPDTPPQGDADADGVATQTDNCPAVANHAQLDIDADAIGDACDPDRDGDLVPDLEDDCPAVPDPLQLDEDRNDVGDACQGLTAKQVVGGGLPGDEDGDGVADTVDNCPGIANPAKPPRGLQDDGDADLIGDECDLDVDGDGILDHGPAGLIVDNCLPTGTLKARDTANHDQKDSDGDGIGDKCKAPQKAPTCVNCTTAAPDTAAAGGGAERVTSKDSVPLIIIIGIVVGAAIGGILAVVSLRRRGGT